LSLSHLELVLLLSEGREAEARERARFWLQRLSRMRDPDLGGLIDFVRDVAENGGAAMISLARSHDPEVHIRGRPVTGVGDRLPWSRFGRPAHRKEKTPL